MVHEPEWNIPSRLEKEKENKEKLEKENRLLELKEKLELVRLREKYDPVYFPK